MANKEKKLARQLQALSEGATSYMGCLHLLRTRGYEAAEKQILEWKAEGTKELAALGKAAP